MCRWGRDDGEVLNWEFCKQIDPVKCRVGYLDPFDGVLQTVVIFSFDVTVERNVAAPFYVHWSNLARHFKRVAWNISKTIWSVTRQSTISNIKCRKNLSIILEK